VADPDYPLAIKFYCSSFDSKDAVESFIKEYNDQQTDSKKQIQYSDSLSTMMTFVNTMAEVITGVLVAFAAISLVVSTIMIAIIIYTSVLERRKEIGVLRSIGARKKDVARVFLAESAILGGYSGIIGVVVSCLISLAGSAILKSVFGIANIMQVEWWHAVMMLGISVLLSMLAGFVPSRVAAKKDPAIALRSE
jgi:putative ABC transport system permease protein